MTQVWIVGNSDTQGKFDPVGLNIFNRFDHILPSLRISYCRCQDVEILHRWDGASKAIFTIKGKREGIAFEEIVETDRYSVWTEPCHL